MIVFFCSFDISRHTSKSRSLYILKYSSAIPLVLHIAETSDPYGNITFEDSPSSDSENTAHDDFQCNKVDDESQPFNPFEHTDLIRYLGLSKGSATSFRLKGLQIASFRLKGKLISS